jgi:hypothetical protein
MFSDEQDGVGAKRTSCSGGRETRLRRSIFARHALQRPGVLAASLTTGFLIGIAYRYFVYDPTPGNLANYARSGIHGAGLALTARVVQTAFASNARSSLGLALRRLPLWGELLIRALVMTAALIVVGVSLQLVLYAEPLGLHEFTSGWFTSTLPRIVAIGFAISLVFGALTEIGRLIGGPVLTSVVLGTYHRPVREELIVMFLDIAGSTRLAEEMGELKVHDLITRFFFDIDEPIADHGGTVHAYGGRGDRLLAGHKRRVAQCAVPQMLFRDRGQDGSPRARVSARIRHRPKLPRRAARGPGDRQRMWRCQAPARLFWRYDECRGETLRVLQGGEAGPRRLGRAAASLEAAG